MKEEKGLARGPAGTLNEADSRSNGGGRKKDVDDFAGAKDHDNGVGQADPGQWTKKNLRRYFNLLGKLEMCRLPLIYGALPVRTQLYSAPHRFMVKPCGTLTDWDADGIISRGDVVFVMMRNGEYPQDNDLDELMLALGEGDVKAFERVITTKADPTGVLSDFSFFEFLSQKVAHESRTSLMAVPASEASDIGSEFLGLPETQFFGALLSEPPNVEYLHLLTHSGKQNSGS